ncbi:glycosyltransferase [candidate division KSB1 bacterium]|nr:glycosyltransferase [candidate division KSB1 bacterium]
MSKMENRKLKILQVVDGFRMGGAEGKLCELIGLLDTDKFENFIANVGPNGPLDQKFAALGVPIYACQRQGRFDLKPVRQLRQIMQEQKIDIVMTTLFWADVVGSIAAKLANVPVVLSWETVTHEGNPYHAQLQRRLGYQLAMRFTDKVIAVSHEIKDSLMHRRGLPAEKIEVIHYGVDLKKFYPNGVARNLRSELGIPKNHVILAITARLEEVKGHRYFVDAFKQIADTHPDVTAIFIGDGSCREALQKQVGQHQLEDRIRFLGIRDDVNAILNMSDVFVLPSIGGEGLPNVVLEAMACGKPVIATAVGGTPEAVLDGENGYVVPPKDVAALGAALRNILQQNNKIVQFGKNSRKRAEDAFSLGKQIYQFEMFYQNMFAEKAFRAAA